MLTTRVVNWLSTILSTVPFEGSNNGNSTCPTGPTTLNTGRILGNTILVLATNSYYVDTVTGGLEGYGIPWDGIVIPKAGLALPELNSTAQIGNYGGIVIVGEVGYKYTDGWYSALSSEQFEMIYEYQRQFGIRMVRLNVYPLPEFGASTAVPGKGCCDAGVEQLVSFTDTSEFPSANLKTGAGVTTKGLAHFPAVVTNASIATSFAAFEPAGIFTESTTAGVINKFDDGRQQMVFFISWAIQWSATSNYLQHSYIHWITRGMFVGKRKTHLAAQIDDMHLSTGLYHPANTEFRTSPVDIEAHKNWQVDLNSRLPAGSNFFLEIAHNGNGDIINATDSEIGRLLCDPSQAVDYRYPDETPLEFKKVVGTGVDLWDASYTTYNWTRACADLDPLALWYTIPENRDAFAHLSHTFSHEELNNATYSDAAREIQFNRAWLAQMGIDKATHFSTHGLVPPAITGLHNGDVIKAWIDNNITNVVGDNTRAPLMNPNSIFWPRISNVLDNGFDGLTILPRFATTIYYNCDTAECTVKEWVDTSGGSGNFNDLLEDATLTNTRYLLGLHADPYMFHQANMRHLDMPVITVGNVTARMSLVQAWVEAVAQEMTRITNWPIITLKHDDISTFFHQRMALDQCVPNLAYHLDDEGKNIVSVTLVTDGNVCSVPVPVTLPTSTVTGGFVTLDQVGSEPLIQWATMSGQPIKFTLAHPISLL